MNEAAAPFLPFHCPRLKADFFKAPCAKKLMQVKALKTEFKLPFLGPLEHCWVCQGKELVRRAEPFCADPQKGSVEMKTEGEEAMAVQLSVAEAKRVLPKEVLERPEAMAEKSPSPQPSPARGEGEGRRAGTPALPAAVEPAVNQSIKQSSQPPAAAGPEQAGPRPQGETGMRKGRLSVSEAEEIFGKEKVGEILAPAVARLAAALVPLPPRKQKREKEGQMKEQKMCAKHGKPIKFNRRGYSMGGCEDCRKEISASGGAAADPMLRLFKGREELRTWIEAEAQRQVRTPEQQMVWCCLQAQAAEKT